MLQKGFHSLLLRVLRSRSAIAIVLGLGCSGRGFTRYYLRFFVPEVQLRSSWVWDVLEGDALVISLGFFVPEVQLRSSWVWDFPEGDSLVISLGFFVPEVLLRSPWNCDVPEGDALAIALGLESAKCYCVPFRV